LNWNLTKSGGAFALTYALAATGSALVSLPADQTAGTLAFEPFPR
jgi:hypothetical protein